ncbi:hypothetical protein RZO55_05575 [Clostridium boliviensis]|uniref:Uncharacterized protein n=1 Tax=Clostridium boliviensis TaxID=318465 RepID=A0ABU4GHF2_9CLOT|nr:hypothetical protein [Clostridium boliviensis]MDW2797049.1 hypothetical protein [Clostridium boliviensis]
MFLGSSFASSKESLTSSLVSSCDVADLTIADAVFDEIYSTVTIVRLTDKEPEIPTDWGFHTRLHALFQDNLYGGNVSFTESIVESVRIKKKVTGDKKFKTIYEKPISSNEDFKIELMDYYEPVGSVEYAYVPVISGGENSYITNQIESVFDSYFICEKDLSYPMILDTSFEKKLTQKTSLIELLGREKPLIIKGGRIRYYTGDISCTFIELKDDVWQTHTSWDYRNGIYDFLTNGKPKILKDYLGNIYMIAVTSNDISEDSDHYEHVITKFSVAECGSAYEPGDLYDNGFIDADIDR